MFIKSSLIALALSATVTSSLAQVRVEEAWVRATVPAQRATGAFMKITSDRPMRLVAVRSSASPTVEIHEMKMANDVMTMREVSGIDIVPGKATALTPGGYHVMMLDLPRQIKVGDTVPLTLVFEDAGKKRTSVEVSAQARALNAPASAPMASMPH